MRISLRQECFLRTDFTSEIIDDFELSFIAVLLKYNTAKIKGYCAANFHSWEYFPNVLDISFFIC